MTRRRRRGFDRQAKKGAGGLLFAGLTEGEQPATGGARLEAQAPAFGEAEFLRIAMHFEKHGRKGARGKGCFGEPERILDAAWQGMHQGGGCQAEIQEAGGIGKARFAHHLVIGDEEQSLPTDAFRFRRHQGHGQTQTGHAPCLLQLLPAQLQQGAAGQHVPHQGVKDILLFTLSVRMDVCRSVSGALGCQACGMVRLSLDPGNRLPQGKKRLARLRALAHDDLSW